MRKSVNRSKILSFVQDFIRDKEYAPTISEIQKACSISSKSVVSYNLENLRQQGYIKRFAGIQRGIQLTNPEYRERIEPQRETMVSDGKIPIFTGDWRHVTVGAEIIKKKDQSTCPNCGYIVGSGSGTGSHDIHFSFEYCPKCDEFIHWEIIGLNEQERERYQQKEAKEQIRAFILYTKEEAGKAFLNMVKKSSNRHKPTLNQ